MVRWSLQFRQLELNMLGKPKYKLGDNVKFTVFNDGQKLQKEGYIYIIDPRGTFFDKSDVNYDIMVDEENCLYKHINEKNVVLI